MKDINVKIETKLSLIIAGALLLVFAGLLAFSYKEMSSIRRDLYAIRGDYYGGWSETSYADEASRYSPVETEIISQELRSMRIYNDSAIADTSGALDPTEEYKQAEVIEVKVKVTNKESFNYPYFDGSFGIETGDGRIVRNLVVHPDDSKNQFGSNAGYGLELAPGGSAEVYLYFPDYGEVETIQYLQ